MHGARQQQSLTHTHPRHPLTETQTLLWLDPTAYTHIHTHTLHKQTHLHTEHKHDAHTFTHTHTHTHFTNKHTYTLNRNIRTHTHPPWQIKGDLKHTHSHTHTLKAQAKLFFTITTKLEPQRHNHCIVGSKANKPRQHKSQQA